MNYSVLYEGDSSLVDIKKLISDNRELPLDWCSKCFSFESHWMGFKNIIKAIRLLYNHVAIHSDVLKQKFQIIVDSDMDGFCSGAIMYKFIKEYTAQVNKDIEVVYSIHAKRLHGLTEDIAIDNDVTLVIIPDAGSNDIEQCKRLNDRNVDVLILDHHNIEEANPYAVVVNCMDGQFPNKNLCGTAVSLLYVCAFDFVVKRNMIGTQDWEAIENGERIITDNYIDIAAAATISDIMDVRNNDNMFLIQYGLQNIQSNLLKEFCSAQEIPLDDVTIEHIKYKVAPLISALIRMGTMEEKLLLFRAFIDDYEEFSYEKRGSFDVSVENIYQRVVRLCKNAKSRQDRAREKLLKMSIIHEYPHMLLVEYDDENGSALTGLIASELANKYCKPTIVYRSGKQTDQNGNEVTFTGSARNYDGSPIINFKQLLSDAFQNDGKFLGHNNAFGVFLSAADSDIYAKLVEDKIDKNLITKIGQKVYVVDFAVDASDVDLKLVKELAYFDHYTGFGFKEVLVLVKNIAVCDENFSLMGKNVFSWKITDDDIGYVKFRIPDDDPLKTAIDDIDFSEDKKLFSVDAICRFGFNVYNGTIYAQGIVKDYEMRQIECKTDNEQYNNEEDNWDLDF